MSETISHTESLDDDNGFTVTALEYMREQDSEGETQATDVDYDSMNDLRNLEEFTIVRDFILFNKNGFDLTEINPAIAKVAEWDIKARYANYLSDQAKQRAGEIVRSSRDNQNERKQISERDRRKVGTAALKNVLRIGKPSDIRWMKDAHCRSADPDAFFPEKGGSTRDAKKICAKCPVSEQCLDYALENGERFGVWGGLSERERRRVRRLANDTEMKKAS